MLTELTVENYALIESLRLALSPSLNIITGETGAGKSILLGALGLLVGNRADASVMMDGDRRCVVEGVFDISGYGLEELFEANDVDYEPQTVIRRVISGQGKSRAYVNELPVQLSFLRELGNSLIDIHSQNQSLRIADESFRLQVVDGMAGCGELLKEYGGLYRRLGRARAELERLRADAAEARTQREWLTHQVEELRGAAFTPGEQQALEASLDELSNAEEIKRTLMATGDALSREEDGVLVTLREVATSLERISGVYPRAAGYVERLRSVREELKDIDRESLSEADRIEADAGALARTEERMGLLFSLLKKHNAADLEELLAVGAGYEARLGAIESSSENIESLKGEIAALDAGAREVASRITAARAGAAAAIEKEAASILASLGMPDAVFTVEITAAESLKSNGADDVRFLFSANRGVGPQPVEKIASGGEMSRVMLALKSIAARSRRLPTIIFDEIDAGVSGRVADAMGEIISALAGGMQVVNITHLPQVAAKGDCHLFVYKDTTGGSARTGIRKLGHSERVEVIAGMLSGSRVTEAAVAQAKTLLGCD